MSNETNDPKKRPGAVRVEKDDLPEEYPMNPPMAKPVQKATPGKWWESTNFFASLILFLAGFWGLSAAEFDATVKQGVMLVYSLIGIGGGIRVYLVNAKLDIRKWLNNPNAYQYLVAALAGIIPNLPADADDKLYSLVQAIKTGNIGIIISAAVTFAVFVWNVWKSQPPKKAAEDQ
jgi:hypothetical protein